MEPGLISVGMPVLDAGGTIGVAIRSILSQTYDHWELLVIDDGSTDRTLDIARGFHDPRIRIVADGDHRGLATRLNEAIALSSGAFFARMDADDVAYPERFESQLRALQATSGTDLVGTWVAVFKDDGHLVGKRTAPSTHDELLSLIGAIPIPHPTFLGRTEWFRRHGYRTGASGFEDQLLLLTTFRHSRFTVVPELLLGYREDSLSLAKQLRYRSSYFRSWRPLMKGLGPARTVVILVAQAGKVLLDAIAIGTGLQYRLLRKRARAVDEGERARWAEVWRRVNEPDD